MTESYRDKLNEIDHRCLDEDLKFYDLRSLFESVAPKLSAEDKEEIKKVIQNTNDAETIAAVLQAKAMDEKNESLEEKLIDAPQEVVDELINILNKYGFVLDDSFKVNPGKTFMGDTHMQVINPESLVDISDEIDIQDQLQKYVTQDLIDEIHDLDQKSDCPITWNFGPNKDGQVTGGLDIMKQYVEESYKDVYYVIMDKHGNQLSRPTKDDSELWDRVESRDPKGTRGLKVVVYTDKVDEKLNEASYGGAYDIEDDMFFTRDDLNEFLNVLIDKLDNYFGYSFDVYDAYLSDPTHFYIELIDENHDINMEYGFEIDMRRIRKPSDLQKYIPETFKHFVQKYQNEYDQWNFDESLKEDYIWEITYGKGRPGGNIEHVKFPEYKDAFEYAANNAHGWGFDIKNISLEKSNKPLKESEDSYFDYDEAVKYIESKGINADPTTYVGEYVCDMLDDFASDDETYSKEDLDSIINDVQQLIGETDSEASFNIIIDGQKLEDVTAEDIKWAKEDIENANIDVNDVYEYHVNEDADYFIITFKDGTKKAWYIHSGMYIPDKDFIDESLNKEEVDKLRNRLFELNKAIENGEDPESISWEKEKIFNRLDELGVNYYTESVDDDTPYTYEQMERELRSATNEWTEDNFEGWVGYKDEFDSAMQILSHHYENVDNLGYTHRGYGFFATRPSLFEDTVKQGNKWVNKGKEGTHGKFATKKAADAQRKAMFANGYNESLNEVYSVGYVKGNPYNQDMIYSVSVNPAQKNGKGERYSIVTLHLVCGKDYVDSTAYDGQAWVDAKQFVDDVQLEQIVWYPDDESLADALEANDYIECNRPHFIWHYDEEKDDWYRNTYIESLSEDYQQEKDEWGEPYSYDEVERELKSITNNWTDKEGTIRCYWEQEKNYGLQILKKYYKYVETSDGRTGKGEDMSWVLAYSKPKEIFDESLNESVTSQLQDKIIDCLDWFILMEMEFPKGKFLADSWEDVKDGIQMGIDPEFEIAEGIVEYLKPIITFNKRYNKEVEEEGVFQDEIEMYQSLVRAMNNYLAKNGYEERIEE